MVRVKIDNEWIEVEENITILEACKKIKKDIPTLCYLKDINEIGACKVCSVEVKGVDRLVTSCNNLVVDGMEILTNSKKVREARKVNIELILSKHKFQCATCEKSEDCKLRKITYESGIRNIPYEIKYKNELWNKDRVLFKDLSKCIECMRCLQICSKIQTVNVWDLIGTGSRATIGVKNNIKFDESNCTLCGQCVVNCPVGALKEREDFEKVLDEIMDPNVVTVVQIAPATRTVLYEVFGEDARLGNLVSTLKKIGVDYVLDTSLAADFTIMEEAAEFVERVKKGIKGPLMTSCCPAWVKFVENEYPEFKENISSVKSPQQIYGSLIKTYFAKKNNIEKRIVVISLMPCIAKKRESEFDYLSDERAVDYVLTTREIEKLLKAARVKFDLDNLENFDSFSSTTGSGIIFGVSGGVTKSALKTAKYYLTGETSKERIGDELTLPIEEKKVKIGDLELNILITSGLGNARKALEDMKSGRKNYDFIEVMACPGGCVNGGGQTKEDDAKLMYEDMNQEKIIQERSDELLAGDYNLKIINSHENPEVIRCYEEFLGKPLSEKAHKLLHRK